MFEFLFSLKESCFPFEITNSFLNFFMLAFNSECPSVLIFSGDILFWADEKSSTFEVHASKLDASVVGEPIPLSL